MPDIVIHRLGTNGQSDAREPRDGIGCSAVELVQGGRVGRRLLENYVAPTLEIQSKRLLHLIGRCNSSAQRLVGPCLCRNG